MLALLLSCQGHLLLLLLWLGSPACHPAHMPHHHQHQRQWWVGHLLLLMQTPHCLHCWLCSCCCCCCGGAGAAAAPRAAGVAAAGAAGTGAGGDDVTLGAPAAASTLGPCLPSTSHQGVDPRGGPWVTYNQGAAPQPRCPAAHSGRAAAGGPRAGAGTHPAAPAAPGCVPGDPTGGGHPAAGAAPHNHHHHLLQLLLQRQAPCRRGHYPRGPHTRVKVPARGGGGASSALAQPT
jgi:hypothetical protein